MNNELLFKYKQISIPKTNIQLIEPDVLYKASIRNGYDIINKTHIPKPPSEFQLLCIDIKNTVMQFIRQNWLIIFCILILLYFFYSRYYTYSKMKEERKLELELNLKKQLEYEKQKAIELELAHHNMEQEKLQINSLNNIRHTFQNYDDSQYKPEQVMAFNNTTNNNNIIASNPMTIHNMPLYNNAGYHNYGIIMH